MEKNQYNQINKIILVLLAVSMLLVLAGCGGSDEDLEDTDGDITDGDVTDGDTTDGDTTDGDETDGDADEPVDGDVDGDSEPDDQPLACDEEVAERPVIIEEDDTFDLGPYLMQPTETSIIVRWRTLVESDSIVHFGSGDEPDQTVSDDTPTTLHEVPLTGLEPNTKYVYSVESDGVESARHSFYTDPGKNQGFRYVVWGDNQSHPDIFGSILDGAAMENPYLCLGVGDQVAAGNVDEQWKTQLFDPARALFHQVAFYAAIGNHEGNSQNLYDLYSFPHPEDDPDHESFYSFTYGNAFFLVIDTNKIFYPIGDAETEGSQWVREQIASPQAQNATWRFALGHQSGYSEGWGDGDCNYDGFQPVRGWLLPLLAENQFHAYFSGHTHGYERGMVDGVAHFITGGGGGALDAWCYDMPTTTVAHYEHHFLSVEVGCDTLRIEAVYPDGERFDWLELSADDYGEMVDEGPVEDLPDPVINSDSPEAR